MTLSEGRLQAQREARRADAEMDAIRQLRKNAPELVREIVNAIGGDSDEATAATCQLQLLADLFEIVGTSGNLREVDIQGIASELALRLRSGARVLQAFVWQRDHDAKAAASGGER